MRDKKSVREQAAEFYQDKVFTRRQLASMGVSGKALTKAVREGRLERVRRDRYALPGTEKAILDAIRHGGRLSCLSLLRLLGVFVQTCDEVHVHVSPGSSRTKKPSDGGIKRHWTAWSHERSPLHAAPLADAVSQAIRCQTPRAAIATLDSIVHHRLLREDELAAIFETLPLRFRVLLALVDGSAESGPETYMRLILRALGVRYETQVVIPGVGRVDFLVEGWLIIECDSKEYHEGWDKQVEDRARDLAAAKLGYVTIRPLAVDIMNRGSVVRDDISAVIEALGSRGASGRVRNSSRSRALRGRSRRSRGAIAILEEL